MSTWCGVAQSAQAPAALTCRDSCDALVEPGGVCDAEEQRHLAGQQLRSTEPEGEGAGVMG